MERGQLVQASVGPWCGCIGTTVKIIARSPTLVVWLVSFYRDVEVAVSESDMVEVTAEQAASGELPFEYRDAQVARVDAVLRPKVIACEALSEQIKTLHAQREECENGAIYRDNR